MAISSYAELQAAVTSWLQDSSLAPAVPDFIALAEAEFGRLLRVPAMETATTLAISGETVALPADFLAAKQVTLLTNPQRTLEGATLGTLKLMHGGTTGEPAQYAIAEGKLWFGPVPDGSYSVQIIYWAAIPALSNSNASNWLLARHPDLYLFGALMQAEFYGWNDRRLPLVKARVDEVLAQVADEGKRQAYPARMVMQHGVRGG